MDAVHFAEISNDRLGSSEQFPYVRMKSVFPKKINNKFINHSLFYRNLLVSGVNIITILKII